MDTLCAQFNINCIEYNGQFYAKCVDLYEYVFYDEFIPNNKPHIKKQKVIIKFGEIEYMSEDALFQYMNLLHWHPEHYNIRIILGGNEQDVIKCFNKREETLNLALIYEVFRNDYRIVYQYRFGTYFLDAVIFINDNAAIVIEIDENGHRDRQPGYEATRNEIVSSGLMELVRIEPNRFKPEDHIAIIKDKINKLAYFVTKDITIEQLQNELRGETIDSDFYKMIGNGLLSRERYSVDFEDLWRYLGYAYKHDAKKKLINEKHFTENCDYVIKIGKNFAQAHSGAKTISSRGGANRETILLTKLAMYAFCMVSGTTKAKECRASIIKVYTKYQDLILKTRDLMIDAQNRIESDRKTNIAQTKVDDDLRQNLKRLESNNNKLESDLKTMSALYSKERMDNEQLRISIEEKFNRYEKCMEENVQMHDQIEKLQSQLKRNRKLSTVSIVNLKKKVMSAMESVFDSLLVDEMDQQSTQPATVYDVPVPKTEITTIIEKNDFSIDDILRDFF